MDTSSDQMCFGTQVLAHTGLWFTRNEGMVAVIPIEPIIVASIIFDGKSIQPLK